MDSTEFSLNTIKFNIKFITIKILSYLRTFPKDTYVGWNIILTLPELNMFAGGTIHDLLDYLTNEKIIFIEYPKKVPSYTLNPSITLSDEEIANKFIISKKDLFWYTTLSAQYKMHKKLILWIIDQPIYKVFFTIEELLQCIGCTTPDTRPVGETFLRDIIPYHEVWLWLWNNNILIRPKYLFSYYYKEEIESRLKIMYCIY